MSKLRKMKQTREAKENFSSPIMNLLFMTRTKKELCEIRGVSERAIRNEIAECSMYYPVIATSDKSGYRLAKSISDLDGDLLLIELDEVEHQIRELNSRIKCLKKRLKPLIAYKKVAEKKLTGRLIEIDEEETENE